MHSYYTKIQNYVNWSGEERNRLVFQGDNCKTVRNLGASVIALVQYWCMIKEDNYRTLLHNILPSNINSLSVQITTVTASLELPEEEVWFENRLEMINISS
jgi:hypothetical protein